ncbi:MAG: hypothetical protein GY710_21640 [Desulfobacteraceae bacterium]|nr:hypothetical protein [Desulfobacteraceae bacterium]
MSRINAIVPIVLILALSLLLIYIGYSETHRSYQKFKLDQLNSKALIVQDLMEAFLKIGLPFSLIKNFMEKDTVLGRFAGFDEFSQGNQGIENRLFLIVSDQKNKKIFSTFPANGSMNAPSSSDDYIITLPLFGKSHQKGTLKVILKKSVIRDVVNKKFYLVIVIIGLLSLIFCIFVIILSLKDIVIQKKYKGAGYFAFFIVIIMLNIYVDGAISKSRVLSDSLANRLEAITNAGTSFEHTSGLDNLFARYKALDSDVKSIFLLENGRITIHQNKAMIRQPFEPDQTDHCYSSKIDNTSSYVMVQLNDHVILKKVLHSVKKLLILLVAISFMAYLFFNLASTIEDRSAHSNNRKKYCSDKYLPDRNSRTNDLRKDPPDIHVFQEYQTMTPVW